MLNRSQPQAYEHETVALKTISSYYSFSGRVKVQKSQAITANVDVTIRELFVKEGQRVEQDDRVVRTSDRTMRSGINGTIDRIYVDEDDQVKMGAPLVDIVDYENMVIEIKVDEFDVSAVSVGKTVEANINALGLSYETEITRLEKQAVQEGNVSYYKAELGLGGNEGILAGMQVDVKVLNAYAENVPTLSMDAIRFNSSNEPYVLIQTETGETKEVPVKVGVNDGLSIEIVEGLKIGDTVLLDRKGPAMPQFGPGVTVRGGE